jgi:pimeloyl-ACP methyl ester carboxylesterase
MGSRCAGVFCVMVAGASAVATWPDARLTIRGRVPRMSATAVPFTPNAPRDGGTINEPCARWALSRMLRADVEVSTPELRATVPTVFMRPTPSDERSDAPVVLFLHGADFSCLEWRFLLERLCADGVDCVALDWYSGGWTDRTQINARLEAAAVAPWTLLRQHLRAFWEQQLRGRPVVLVGASLGGAVAIDFASTHPEAVSRLVLVDAGGQSYKAPPPALVSALAAPVLAVKSAFQAVQAALPDDASRIVSLHRAQPGCYEAGLAYLRAGSLQRRVGPERIRTLPQETLVIWGEDDDILPLADAYAFEADLRRCAGVRVVPGSGHSPHLDNPEAVLSHLREFLNA